MRRGRTVELTVVAGAVAVTGTAAVAAMPACARAPSVVVAAVEAADASASPGTGGGAAGAAPGAGADEGRCVYVAKARAVEPSSRDCTIYEQVSQGGTVVVPCGGVDGPASASFGDHEYRGEVRGKRVTLKHSYDFTESDNCLWRIHGKLTGDVSEGRLAFTYSEEILEGDTCLSTCTARARVDVRRRE